MKEPFQGDFSIYVHIPFCEVKCGYCDFYSVPRGWEEFDLQEQYVACLLEEIDRRSVDFAGRIPQSIFFGGGTPSLLRPDLIAQILDRLRGHFLFDSTTEVTLETNPKTVDRHKLAEFRAIGINRISLGVQSFQDKFLQLMGRIHSGAEAQKTLADAYAAGFSNVSLDLIHSLPGQTLAEWQADLEMALSLAPQHLSCYNLTIESGTPFEVWHRQGRIKLPVEDEQANQLLWTRERLAMAGYPSYEISNFSRPGFESVHNRNYWRYGEYLGFGAGAASFCRGQTHGSAPTRTQLFGIRSLNARDLNGYIQGSCKIEEDRINDRMAQGEFVMLGFRTREGINLERFQVLFQSDFEVNFATTLEHLKRDELVFKPTDDQWNLTERGFLLADEVITHFLG